MNKTLWKILRFPVWLIILPIVIAGGLLFNDKEYIEDYFGEIR